MRRCESVVIHSAHDDGHGVVEEGPRQFLRHVIGAKGILERHVELVIAANHFQASVAAGQVAAFAVNVHRYVSAQFLDVIFPVDGRDAIGHEPGRQFLLAAGW